MRGALRAAARCGVSVAGALWLGIGVSLWTLLPTPVQAAPPWAEQALQLFPAADQVAALQGSPPASALLRDGTVVGHAFVTDQIAPLPAYSGQPISVLVTMDLDGVLQGARVLAHSEPILVVGVAEQDLDRFVSQYPGKSVLASLRVGGRAGPGRQVVDGISGATITVMVMNSAIVRAARLVHEAHGLSAATGRVSADPVAASRAAPASGPPPAIDPVALGDAGPAAYVERWQQHRGRLAGLGAGLLVLTAILLLQDWLARFPVPLRRLRLLFLIYTAVFIGWYGQAQLSVLNVFTFLRALRSDFRWEQFLLEPLTFVLWGFVAMTLLLWGRGVYCGWLCPFGALQELAGKLGVRLGLPQLRIPELVHERLLAIKYLLLIGLFGISLHAFTRAIELAEVEPFKTAIVLHFQRPWPYVAYAAALLALAAVNGKFFCKYLCPLGAALAVPSRLRIFDWLRRRPECAHPCQACAHDCPSQAIRPTGEINVNECHYCLDCQMTYWDDHRCPPLVERRKRAERRQSRSQPVTIDKHQG